MLPPVCVYICNLLGCRLEALQSCPKGISPARQRFRRTFSLNGRDSMVNCFGYEGSRTITGGAFATSPTLAETNLTNILESSLVPRWVAEPWLRAKARFGQRHRWRRGICWPLKALHGSNSVKDTVALKGQEPNASHGATDGAKKTQETLNRALP
jgi:hypothetical protein